MSTELNLTKEGIITDKPELSDGESKNASDDNKIVPITNAVADTTANDSAEPMSAAAAHDSNSVIDASITADSAAAANNPAAGSPDITDFTAASPTPDSTASTSDASASYDTAREKSTPHRQSARPVTNSKYYDDDSDEDFHFADEERPKRSFFRFRPVDEEESRDKLILSRIKDEDLMEYLALEQRRLEFLQQAKETKQKRLLTAFQLLISLAAIVAVTYLLQDNPTILISILYIVGIVAALNIWKNPHDKGKWRK